MRNWTGMRAANISSNPIMIESSASATLKKLMNVFLPLLPKLK